LRLAIDSREAIMTSRFGLSGGLSTLSALLLLPSMTFSQSADDPTHVTAPHAPCVRPVGQDMRDLLLDGLSHSATLAGLVAELEKTDLMVRLELSSFLPTSGALSFVSATPAFRCVRIRLRIPNSREELLAMLGHELQHALEVADAPAVRDDAGLRRLYRHIGRANWNGNRFETRAAIEAGWRVRAELKQD
jgi:hypothetical protein